MMGDERWPKIALKEMYARGSSYKWVKEIQDIIIKYKIPDRILKTFNHNQRIRTFIKYGEEPKQQGDTGEETQQNHPHQINTPNNTRNQTTQNNFQDNETHDQENHPQAPRTPNISGYDTPHVNPQPSTSTSMTQNARPSNAHPQTTQNPRAQTVPKHRTKQPRGRYYHTPTS